MKFKGTKKYVSTEDLSMAVNASVTLERPLLIKGEPGTGKTLLAIEVAESLGKRLIEWHIKSTTKATQGLYEYDAVTRLRDSQLGDERVKDINNYINKGKLWEAFEADEQVVLLIDEIDKAPREFPNDLLYALSHRKFVMPESGEVIEVSEEDMPAIVITSNREQELPTAFKGRCIYHYIQFPEADKMRDIIAKHHPKVSNKIVDTALDIFYQLRKIGLERAPTTRELLNWLKYVKTFSSKEALDKLNALDGLGTLIKTQADYEKVQRQLALSGGKPPMGSSLN